MKIRAILLVSILLWSFTSNSQIAPKMNVLGGSAEFDYKYQATGSFGGETKTTSIPIVLKYGRFIIPRLTLGLGVGYTYYKQTSENDNQDSLFTISQPTITFIPQARYYFPIWGEKFYLVAGLNLSYGIQKLKYDLSINGNKDNFYKGNRFIMDLNIRPALVYFIHKNFALEATFGYFGYSRTLRSDSKNALQGSKYNYELKFDFDPSTIAIGINYFFVGKKKMGMDTNQ
jgi:outer membrane protein